MPNGKWQMAKAECQMAFVLCPLSFGLWPLAFDIDMILAKIVGTVVATRKDERLVSSKLLVARPIDPRGKAEGSYLVAVDTVDAGFGETVLIVSGSSARMASGMKDCPVDAAIVGIVDTVDVKD
jgi:ethanolamine utilization protein EutN